MINKKKVFIGIMPTCWTHDDMPLLGNEITFEQCVSEMALAGYQGCSIGHKYPTDAKVLGEALAQRKLSLSEPWISIYFLLPEGVKQTLDSFRERMDFIKKVQDANVSWRSMHGEGAVELPPADLVGADLSYAVHQLPLEPTANRPTFTAQQWTALAENLKNLGNIANENKMRFCYHPYIGTGIQTIKEIITLMDAVKDSSILFN